MIQLIMTICLAASPQHCREERLTLDAVGLHPAQCMYSSIPRIARWRTMNPKWRVESWRCALAGHEESA